MIHVRYPYFFGSIWAWLTIITTVAGIHDQGIQINQHENNTQRSEHKITANEMANHNMANHNNGVLYCNET